jgi:hypothetical protein
MCKQAVMQISRTSEDNFSMMSVFMFKAAEKTPLPSAPRLNMSNGNNRASNCNSGSTGFAVSGLVLWCSIHLFEDVRFYVQLD